MYLKCQANIIFWTILLFRLLHPLASVAGKSQRLCQCFSICGPCICDTQWDIRCWSTEMVKKKINAQRHSGFRVPNSKTSYLTILLTILQYRKLCLPICWAQFLFKIITSSTKLHLQYTVKSSSHTDHAVLGLKSGSPWPGTIVNCIWEVQSQLEESCKLYVRRLPFWALDPWISKLGILAIQKMQNPVP